MKFRVDLVRQVYVSEYVFADTIEEAIDKINIKIAEGSVNDFMSDSDEWEFDGAIEINNG